MPRQLPTLAPSAHPREAFFIVWKQSFLYDKKKRTSSLTSSLVCSVLFLFFCQILHFFCIGKYRFCQLRRSGKPCKLFQAVCLGQLCDRRRRGMVGCIFFNIKMMNNTCCQLSDTFTNALLLPLQKCQEADGFSRLLRMRTDG